MRSVIVNFGLFQIGDVSRYFAFWLPVLSCGAQADSSNCCICFWGEWRGEWIVYSMIGVMIHFYFYFFLSSEAVWWISLYGAIRVRVRLHDPCGFCPIQNILWWALWLNVTGWTQSSVLVPCPNLPKSPQQSVCQGFLWTMYLWGLEVIDCFLMTCIGQCISIFYTGYSRDPV